MNRERCSFGIYAKGAAYLPEDADGASNHRPFSPQQLRNRSNDKDPSYEEVVIPARLTKFAADFSGLSGLLKPNQDMGNVISLVLVRGKSRCRPIRLSSHPRLLTRLGR